MRKEIKWRSWWWGGDAIKLAIKTVGGSYGTLAPFVRLAAAHNGSTSCREHTCKKSHCIRVPKWPKSIFRFSSFLLMTPLCATEKSCIAVLPRRWMNNKAVQRICVLTKSFSFEVCEVWSGVCKGWVCQSVKLEVGGRGEGGEPINSAFIFNYSL